MEVVSLGRGTEEKVEKQRAEVSGILKTKETSEEKRGIRGGGENQF